MFQLFVEMLEVLGDRGEHDTVPDLLESAFWWGKTGTHNHITEC